MDEEITIHWKTFCGSSITPVEFLNDELTCINQVTTHGCKHVYLLLNFTRTSCMHVFHVYQEQVKWMTRRMQGIYWLIWPFFGPGSYTRPACSDWRSQYAVAILEGRPAHHFGILAVRWKCFGTSFVVTNIPQNHNNFLIW